MAGPNPSFADIWVDFGKWVALWNAIEQFGNANTPNVLDLYDDIVINLDGEYAPSSLSLLEGDRASLAAPLSPARMRQVATLFINDMLRAADIKNLFNASTAEKLRALRQYMVDNSQTINSRNMTLSAPSVGTATGDGTVRRLTTDKDSNTIEAVNPETLTFEVIRDQTSGAQKHAEVFEVTGTPRGRDGLQWEGSSIRTELASLHALSARLVQNPSFDTNDASADDSAPGSTTAVTNWTIGSSAANFALRSSASFVYRGYPGNPATLWSLEFNDNDSISQVLRDVNAGAQFDPNVPYFCRIAYQRKDSCDGDLDLDLGASNATVDLTTATNDQWAHLFIALDQNSWYENFKQNDLDIVITLANRTTGSVVVDDVILAPMTNIGGSWYAIDGGDVAWLRGDTWTAASTDGGTRAKFQYWLWRMFGPQGWLPTNNAGTETISDPA